MEDGTIPTPAAGIPAAASASITRTELPPAKRRFSGVTRVGAWLLLIAICTIIYFRATSYGTRIVEAHPVEARIEISNPPPWLDRRIVNSLLDEAYQFAGKDMTTYNRSRDVLDGGILKEFANLYTGSDKVDGKVVSRQVAGYNAWISKVTQVRRSVAQDKAMQTIQIVVEWRVPAAWIRVQRGGEPMLCLIDAEGTRLPGDYHVADRGNSPLMVIAGVDAPKVGNGMDLPQAGEKWFARPGAMGDDLVAGMQLLDVLKRQRFSGQIAAIDMSNFAGRHDAKTAWIVLETIWPSSTGVPRVVEWGRPIGQEKYYEVQAAVKIKALRDIYARFKRIDADRDYVDIRSDVLRLPKLAVDHDTIASQSGKS